MDIHTEALNLLATVSPAERAERLAPAHALLVAAKTLGHSISHWDIATAAALVAFHIECAETVNAQAIAEWERLNA